MSGIWIMWKRTIRAEFQLVNTDILHVPSVLVPVLAKFVQSHQLPS
jgi:hypothetical protein